MTRRFCRRLIIALALLVPATAAQAHLVSTRFGDFYGGMLHPVSALEHVFPWLALGLLAGLQEPQRGRWMLLLFPLGLLGGMGLAWLSPSLGLMAGVNMLSFVVLGGLVALAWPLPLSVLGGLGILFGTSHGYGNGLAITAETNAALFVAGVASAGYVIITLVTTVTVMLSQKQTWIMIAFRAAGSWIAAIGILWVGVELAGF